MSREYTQPYEFLTKFSIREPLKYEQYPKKLPVYKKGDDGFRSDSFDYNKGLIIGGDCGSGGQYEVTMLFKDRRGNCNIITISRTLFDELLEDKVITFKNNKESH